jgi:outer membrane protein OmpA-like peptidoglycan-associated protein
VQPDRIELRAPVTFDAAMIREGQSVLGQVGALLRAHDEIAVLRIVVHAPDVAIAEHRAKAIRDWLVQWGVAGTRLEARGSGGDESIDLLVVH